MKVQRINAGFHGAHAVVALSLDEINALDAILQYADLDAILKHEGLRDVAEDMAKDVSDLFHTAMREIMNMPSMARIAEDAA